MVGSSAISGWVSSSVGIVVDHGGLLRRFVGAEPEAHAPQRVSDLCRPLPLRPLPHGAELPLRGGLHALADHRLENFWRRGSDIGRRPPWLAALLLQRYGGLLSPPLPSVVALARARGFNRDFVDEALDSLAAKRLAFVIAGRVSGIAVGDRNPNDSRLSHLGGEVRCELSVASVFGVFHYRTFSVHFVSLWEEKME